MRARALAALLVVSLGAASRGAAAPSAYGAKGLFPVYDVDGTWLVYDKTSSKADAKALRPRSRFLLVGSAGEDLFSVARSSVDDRGLCRARKPAPLRAAVLGGARGPVGEPILAVKVPRGFSLKGSRAVTRPLANAVDEALYRSLGATLAAATFAEVKAGAFKFKPGDPGAAGFAADPALDKILLKIDFAAKVQVAGLKDAMVLVTGAQISNSFRRCLRLVDGGTLIGDCAEMPGELMAETAQLAFVSYDPGGSGNPLLLAYTKEAPLWGHERWGFALRPSGPRPFLRDAMDPRCRSSF